MSPGTMSRISPIDYAEAGEDRGDHYRGEVLLSLIKGLRQGEVGPPIAHVLHRLHERGLQPEEGDERDDGHDQRREPKSRTAPRSGSDHRHAA